MTYDYAIDGNIFRKYVMRKYWTPKTHKSDISSESNLYIFEEDFIMNKQEFMRYIEENFDISGEAKRLINNILSFVELNSCDENEQYNMLCDLLDNTIGLSDEEIRKVYF